MCSKQSTEATRTQAQAQRSSSDLFGAPHRRRPEDTLPFALPNCVRMQCVHRITRGRLACVWQACSSCTRCDKLPQRHFDRQRREQHVQANGVAGRRCCQHQGLYRHSGIRHDPRLLLKNGQACDYICAISTAAPRCWRGDPREDSRAHRSTFLRNFLGCLWRDSQSLQPRVFTGRVHGRGRCPCGIPRLRYRGRH